MFLLLSVETSNRVILDWQGKLTMYIASNPAFNAILAEKPSKTPGHITILSGSARYDRSLDAALCFTGMKPWPFVVAGDISVFPQWVFWSFCRLKQRQAGEFQFINYLIIYRHMEGVFELMVSIVRTTRLYSWWGSSFPEPTQPFRERGGLHFASP